MPGKLYVVATPIGNLEDITLRALKILTEVSVIAAEDTRHTKILLNHFNIKTSLISIHAHNEKERSPQVLAELLQDKNVAYVTDAGTPVISDPGSHLIALAREQGVDVSPIPGPCAAIAALSASGLGGQQFFFYGFLPTKSAERLTHLKRLKSVNSTLIFYEAPHRIASTIRDLMTVFGENAYLVIARELTKKFETIHGALLKDIQTWLERDPNQQRGEFVLLLKPVEVAHVSGLSDVQKILPILLAELPLKQAVNLTSQITLINKNKIYSLALTLQAKAEQR